MPRGHQLRVGVQQQLGLVGRQVVRGERPERLALPSDQRGDPGARRASAELLRGDGAGAASTEPRTRTWRPSSGQYTLSAAIGLSAS
ncbi:hypothetical protein ACFQ1I_34125 [Kitasatospora arboriphila]